LKPAFPIMQVRRDEYFHGLGSKQTIPSQQQINFI
jgi:hypothetical protein